jgi:hypothetical protein
VIDRLLHLRSSVSKDGAAVLDIERGTLTTLNETGAFVWHALERGESEESIVADLVRATGQPVEAIAGDVRVFLDDLTTQKLISH